MSAGDKLFISATDSAVTAVIYRYTLSPPFDISSPVQHSSLSVATESFENRGIEFSADGLRLYIVDAGSQDVDQYNLTTSFDLTTATFSSALGSGTADNLIGISFKPDGGKFYLVTFNSIREYTLSTPWELSSATFTNSFSTTGDGFTSLRGITWNLDGTKVYFCDDGSDELVSYSASTPWDVTTLTLGAIKGILAGNPYSIRWDTTGDVIFVLYLDKKIVSWVASTPFDITSLTEDLTWDFSAEVSDDFAAGLTFNADSATPALEETLLDSSALSDLVLDNLLEETFPLDDLSSLDSAPNTLSANDLLLDSSPLSDLAETINVYSKVLADNSDLADLSLVASTFSKTLSDSTVLSDLTSEEVFKPVLIENSLVSSDLVSEEVAEGGSIGDFLVSGDIIEVIVTSSETLVEDIIPTENVISGFFIEETLLENLTSSDLATDRVPATFSDTLLDSLVSSDSAVDILPTVVIESLVDPLISTDNLIIVQTSLEGIAEREECDTLGIGVEEVSELEIPEFDKICARLDSLNPVDSVGTLQLEIPEFSEQEPLPPEFNLSEEPFLVESFSASLQAGLDGRLEELVLYKRDREKEFTEWGKIKDEIVREFSLRKSLNTGLIPVEEFLSQQAGRGFPAPPGSVSRDISERDLELRRVLEERFKQFYEEELQEYLRVFTRGLTLGEVSHQLTVRLHNETKRLELEYAVKLAQVHQQFFRALVEKFNQELRAKQIKHENFLADNRAKLLELQALNQSLQAKLSAEESRLIERGLIGVAMEYLQTRITTQELALDELTLRAEETRNQVLTFRSEVDTFQSLLNLNIATFGLYKSRIDLEGSKVDIYRQRVETAQQKIRAQRGKTRVNETEARSRLSIAEEKLRAQGTNLQVAEQKLRNQLINASARDTLFRGDLQLFRSNLVRWVTGEVNEEQFRDAEARAHRDDRIANIQGLSSFDTEVIRLETEAKNLLDLSALDSSVIKSTAEIKSTQALTTDLIHQISVG